VKKSTYAVGCHVCLRCDMSACLVRGWRAGRKVCGGSTATHVTVHSPHQHGVQPGDPGGGRVRTTMSLLAEFAMTCSAQVSLLTSSNEGSKSTDTVEDGGSVVVTAAPAVAVPGSAAARARAALRGRAGPDTTRAVVALQLCLLTHSLVWRGTLNTPLLRSTLHAIRLG
jgi:hypothetical protein